MNEYFVKFQKLIKKECKPPFKPAIRRMDDAYYFDKEFTSKTPKGSVAYYIILDHKHAVWFRV